MSAPTLPPTLPSDHDEYAALAVAWAMDALEPADQADFEAHREGCEECSRTLAAALAIATELAYGAPDAAPPPRLRERVLVGATPRRDGTASEGPAGARAGLTGAADEGRGCQPHGRSAGDPTPEAGRRRPLRDSSTGSVDGATPEAGRRRVRHGASTRPVAGAAPEARTRRRLPGSSTGWVDGATPDARRRRRRMAYALAAAAVLVAGVAVTVRQFIGPAPAADRAAALGAPGGTGRTVATVVARGRGAEVVTAALPPNAGRRTAYYLWGVPAGDGGAPQVVGTFVVTTTGLYAYPVRLTRPLDGYPVLAISEEAAGSTPTAPSGVLGKGTLSG